MSEGQRENNQPIGFNMSKVAPQDGLTAEEIVWLQGNQRETVATAAPLPPRSTKHGYKRKQASPPPKKATGKGTLEQHPVLELEPGVVAARPQSVVTAHPQSEVEKPASGVSILRIICFNLLAVPILAAVVFWAKFALVYNIPVFIRTSLPASGAAAYICYKPWFFGPPIFSLQDVLQRGGHNDVNSLNLALGPYKEIISHSAIVLYRFYR